MLIRDHRHGKEGKKHRTAILPVHKSLLYQVTSITEDGLTCSVKRTDGGDERTLHVNDVLKFTAKTKKRPRSQGEQNCKKKRRKKKVAYGK